MSKWTDRLDDWLSSQQTSSLIFWVVVTWVGVACVVAVILAGGR